MRATAFRKTVLSLLFLGALCAAVPSPVSASDENTDQTQRKYRIGYIEGGPYSSFSDTNKQAQIALDRMRWLERIEFPRDAHFSPGWGDNRDALKGDAETLLNRSDIDLILSAGTDATQALLAVNNGRIPIIGFSVSDPLQSKMVLNEKDSGVDNFTVYFELDAYDRLFRIFHMAIGFNKLGLLYSPTDNGRIYSNVKEAHKIARERGFKVIEYAQISDKESEEECMAGLQWLVDQGIDAFYIPSLTCFDYSLNPESSQRLINFLKKKKIPSFSREGTIDVQAGALLGVSNLNHSEEGKFLAGMIVRVLGGEKPRSLPMIMTNYPSLSMNLETAESIGFQPTFDLLTACDLIFRNKNPQNLPGNR